jgi:hypothetical protein
MTLAVGRHTPINRGRTDVQQAGLQHVMATRGATGFCDRVPYETNERR